MFKKTLIAAALATTALGAVASTVTVTPASVGVEFAAGTSVFDAATVTVDLGRDYGNGDIITLTVAGASWQTTSGTPAVAVTPTLTGTGDAVGKIDFLDYSGSSVRVLVTEDIDATTAAGMTIAGLKLNIAGAADKGKVALSAAGRVSTVDGPINVDASASTDYITFATEYATKVNDGFDGVVDVNKARKEFSTTSGGADSANADTLILEHTRATPADGATTAAKVTYTVYGDFAFLDTDGDGTLETKEGTITSAAGTVALATDFQSVSVTDATGGTFAASGTLGITVTAPADVVIPDQAFTASTDVNYTFTGAPAAGVTKSTLTMASAGAWTLNGAKAHIPFLPFGSNFSQSVTVSNTSTQTGGVDLVVYVGGDTMEVEGIATVGAEGVTDLSSAIRTAVANMGITTGNLSMDVIINAPDAAITVEALYFAKSDADRLRTL